LNMPQIYLINKNRMLCFMLNGLATETVHKFSYLGSNISNQNLPSRNRNILNNSWFSHGFPYISLQKNRFTSNSRKTSLVKCLIFLL